MLDRIDFEPHEERSLKRAALWMFAAGAGVVEAWRASGLRVQAFARLHGLGAWRLRYWAPRVSNDPQPGKTSRVRRGKASRGKASSTELKFVPAVITGVALGERPAVVVRLPGESSTPGASTR